MEVVPQNVGNAGAPDLDLRERRSSNVDRLDVDLHAPLVEELSASDEPAEEYAALACLVDEIYIYIHIYIYIYIYYWHTNISYISHTYPYVCVCVLYLRIFIHVHRYMYTHANTTYCMDM